MRRRRRSPVSPASVLPPERWPEAQAELRRGAPGSLAGRDRTPVRFRWWTVARHEHLGDGVPARAGFPLVGPALFRFVVERLAGVAGTPTERLAHPEGCHVALYPADAAPGAHPVLVFEVGPDAFDAPEGRGGGVLLGKPAANGALVLEIGDRLVWPVYYPRAPYRGSPTW